MATIRLKNLCQLQQSHSVLLPLHSPMEDLNLALFFLSLFLLLIVKLLLNRHRRRKLPPSPFALPIISHLYLLKTPLHQSLQSLLERYGPILHLRLGFRSLLVVSSPSAIEDCFTKNDIVFASRPRTLAADVFTYNYAAFPWSPYGDLWRSLRRLAVVEIFSSNSLQRSAAVREEESRNLVRRLFVLSGGEPRRVDLKLMSYLFTTNISMRLVAGRRCVAEGADLEAEERFIMEFKKKFFSSISMNPCDFFPFLRWIGYKGIEKSMIQIQKLRDAFLQSLVDEVRLRRKQSSSSEKEKKRTSIIDTLLSLQESEPEFYTEDVIKSIGLVMFIAGTDTSAMTLEWAMSLLLNHPKEMQKLRAEIDKTVGHDRLINDLDHANLPYLSCVINETLRLYPPGPLLLPHSASENCIVGGFEVPKGTILVANVYATHRDPKVWEDPTEFKPQRFEEIEGESFKFIPFGMGRRACPGAAMGMRTVALALGALVQCFDWEKIGQEVDMSQGIGPSLTKAKPLEALCSSRPTMIKLISQL